MSPAPDGRGLASQVFLESAEVVGTSQRIGHGLSTELGGDQSGETETDRSEKAVDLHGGSV